MKKTETYTEEVEREDHHYVCDGPDCDEVWETEMEFAQNVNIVIANPWVPRERIRHKMPVLQPPTRDGYFVSTEDPYAVPHDGKMYDEGQVRADSEIHLCNDCYEYIKPIFGMEGFFGQHDEDDEEDEDDSFLDEQGRVKMKGDDERSVWDRIVELFS